MASGFGHRSSGDPGQKEWQMPGITVGVDGSDHSYRALEWAMKEAGLRKQPVNIYAVHDVAANQWTGHPMVAPEDEPIVQHARSWAEEAVAKITSQLGGAKPTSVNVQAMSGFAAEELIKASHDSDLVVVSARGSGRFARLAVGGVASKVIHHATCPVVVVPASK
jgi:nucleotide-binding universal stress UspA family protein